MISEWYILKFIYSYLYINVIVKWKNIYNQHYLLTTSVIIYNSTLILFSLDHPLVNILITTPIKAKTKNTKVISKQSWLGLL